MIPSLPAPQEWKNQPVSWKYEEGVLTMEAGPITDWFISPAGDKQFFNAPILLFPAAHEFILTATISAAMPVKWDAGALMVYVNDTTWAKFAFEKTVYLEPTVVSVVTKGISDDCNSEVVRADSVRYRVVKQGDAIGFFRSTDGAGWKMVRKFTFGAVEGLKAGFAVQSPAGQGTTASFSGIEYRVGSVRDFAAAE